MSSGLPPADLPDNKPATDSPAESPGRALAPYWTAAVIESADDAIITGTLEGRITSWNKGAERIFGYTAEEAIGKPVTILIPEDRTDEEPAINARLRAGERVEHYETQRVRKDGTLVDISLAVSPIRGPDGNIIGASKIARDVTERKRAEEALRQREEELTDFIENSAMGLHWVAADGTILWANQAELDLLGYTREEYVGHHIAEFHADKDVIDDILGRLTRDETLHDYEARLRCKDGSFRHVLISSNVRRQSEKFIHTRCFTRDITDRLRAEEALRESEEKYRSLLENANDIIYSHDLQGNYLTINRACEEITGYTREEILGGLNIAQVVAPEHLELAKRMTELKLRDPSPTVYEIDILTKDGRRLTLEVSTRIAERNGRGAIVEGIARDVTDRKRAERDREELLAREQQARHDAEEALGVARSIEQSLDVLVEASGVLLGSLTLEDVQPAILDLSRRLISADAYAIWRGDAQAKVWRIVSSAGLTEDYSGHRIEGWEPGNFVFDEPVVAEDIGEVPLLEARRELYRSEGISSLLAVPLRIHGEASGTLTYYYRKPHRFSDRDLRVATALANLSGAAISSAELYDEQRRLRAEAEAAEWRSNFLAEASSVLSSTLDYEATLARVARLAVPDLADWCAVDIREEDNTVRRLAVAHVDPAKVEWAHELQQRYPPEADAPQGVPQVLRTGVSEIYPEITDEMIEGVAQDHEHLRLLRSVGFSSAMLVPLLAHGRTLGVSP